MKVLIAALIMFFVIVVFISTHTYIMTKLSSDIDEICQSAKALAQDEKWNEVQKEINHIKSIWDKSRIWSEMTISTGEIDRIEISLRQSMEYAKIGAKPDFFGEFTVFNMLVNRIPLKEGFHIEEIL